MSLRNANLKIAIVHDWILNLSGAERVLKVLHDIFPQAPIYTLVYNKDFTDKFLPKAKIKPSFLQKAYQFLRSHQFLVPFIPMAIESFDFSKFDLVISSSVSFSKGIILRPHTINICYCTSPMRQVWDWSSEYKREKHRTPKLIVILWQHLIRIWDRQAAHRVDHFIAISEVVRKRIKKYYQVDSTVIYPPVEFLKSKIKLSKPDIRNYFLIVSRLFPSKNVDIAVRAFNRLNWPLVVIGDGPERKRLQKIANPNIQVLGHLTDDQVVNYYTNCSGFIMPQEEDFGITPIEAFSYGKPVLALRCGGALEYIEEGINGEFFDAPVPDVLANGVRRMRENLAKYNPEKIKKTAERFSVERFKKELLEFITNVTRV